MKAYKLRSKLIAGMDMIIQDGKLTGWNGSLLQWQTAIEYEKMMEALFEMKENFRNIWITKK